MSTVMVTSTPLPAELYEAETAVAAVTAKILVLDGPNAPVKIRKYSVQVSCAFLVLLLVVVATMAMVFSHIEGRNNDGSNNINANKGNVSTIIGWKPVGGILTVETPYKDNIRFGNSVAISADGSRIAAGLPGSDNLEDENLKSIGSVQIFDLVNDTKWERKAEIFGTYSNAGLGTDVALSNDGKRVAIGTNEAGFGLVYKESSITGRWVLVGNFSNRFDFTDGGILGDTIALSGDGTVVAMGDKYSNVHGLENVGIVNIYEEVDGTWKQIGDSLVGSRKGNLFGWSVALSKNGHRIAVSSLGDNVEPGSVMIFDFNGSSWEEVGPGLVGESSRELFGVSVELSGNGSVVAVGAPAYSTDQKTSVGCVRSYKYDSAKQEWTPHGQPMEGENEFDAFGTSISLSHDGNTIALGGPENGNFCNNCGHVKIFQNKGGFWCKMGSELGNNKIDGGQFGYAVALSTTGNRVVGAAPFSTFNGYVSRVGQVLIFDSIVKDPDC